MFKGLKKHIQRAGFCGKQIVVLKDWMAWTLQGNILIESHR